MIEQNFPQGLQPSKKPKSESEDYLPPVEGQDPLARYATKNFFDNIIDHITPRTPISFDLLIREFLGSDEDDDGHYEEDDSEAVESFTEYLIRKYEIEQGKISIRLNTLTGAGDEPSIIINNDQRNALYSLFGTTIEVANYPIKTLATIYFVGDKGTTLDVRKVPIWMDDINAGHQDIVVITQALDDLKEEIKTRHRRSNITMQLVNIVTDVPNSRFQQDRKGNRATTDQDDEDAVNE